MKIMHTITETISGDCPPEGPIAEGAGIPDPTERVITHQLTLEVMDDGSHRYYLDATPIHRDLFDRLCAMQSLQLAEEHIVSTELLHEDVRTLVEMYEQDRLDATAVAITERVGEVERTTRASSVQQLREAMALTDWIRVGTVVEQTSGAGHHMTVESIDDLGLVQCVWFDEGELRRERFNRGSLREVPPEIAAALDVETYQIKPGLAFMPLSESQQEARVHADAVRDLFAPDPIRVEACDLPDQLGALEDDQLERLHQYTVKAVEQRKEDNEQSAEAERQWLLVYLIVHGDEERVQARVKIATEKWPGWDTWPPTIRQVVNEIRKSEEPADVVLVDDALGEPIQEELADEAVWDLPISQLPHLTAERRAAIAALPRPGCVTPQLCATCGPSCGGRRGDPAFAGKSLSEAIAAGELVEGQSVTLSAVPDPVQPERSRIVHMEAAAGLSGLMSVLMSPVREAEARAMELIDQATVRTHTTEDLDRAAGLIAAPEITGGGRIEGPAIIVTSDGQGGIQIQTQGLACGAQCCGLPSGRMVACDQVPDHETRGEPHSCPVDRKYDLHTQLWRDQIAQIVADGERLITDPDSGCQYTIAEYLSEAVGDADYTGLTENIREALDEARGDDGGGMSSDVVIAIECVTAEALGQLPAELRAAFDLCMAQADRVPPMPGTLAAALARPEAVPFVTDGADMVAAALKEATFVPEHTVNAETQRIAAAARTANDDADAEEIRQLTDKLEHERKSHWADCAMNHGGAECDMSPECGTELTADNLQAVQDAQEIRAAQSDKGES